VFPLKDANPRHGPAYWVWLLIAANALVFLWMTGMDRFQIHRFVGEYGFVPALFFADPAAEGYRLVTSLFLHGGFMHLLGNMFFLGVFGDNIEDRMGHGRFIVFYFLGGVAATLAHAVLTPHGQTPLIGASGAISAVLGAYIFVFPRQRVRTLILPFFLLWLPAWLYLGYWGVIQFVQATLSLGATVQDSAANEVAWWAHVGGFVFGLIAVRLFLKPEYRRG
jgi:membrane associated rhomboid family serine protease